LCRCECGNELVITQQRLTSGAKNCGLARHPRQCEAKRGPTKRF
jgi:hypothetical protein